MSNPQNINSPPTASMTLESGAYDFLQDFLRPFIARYWRDRHVWDTIKNRGLTSREALLFTGIDPENFDLLSNRDSEMEKKWLLQTMQMLLYYTPLQMSRWFDQAIYITSKTQIEQQEILQQIFSEPSDSNISKQRTWKLKGKITDLAREYGLDVKKNKACCPFHADGTPSLSFNDAKGFFYCFGCGAKGNIVEFYRRMEEINNGVQRS